MRELNPTAHRVLLCMLVLLITSCMKEARQEPPAAPQIIGADFAMPPFYRVEGEAGATVLLMGTIHLGPSAGWDFSPAIVRALDRADRFVLEVDLRRATDDAISDLLAKLVIIEPPRQLSDLVSPETAKLLEEKDAVLAQMGMPANARRRMKPWFIAISLIEVSASESGYGGDAAAENAIMETVGARPLSGLESFEEQLALLNDLSPPHQDIMLRDTLMRLDDAVEEVSDLVMAWRLGREDQLTEMAQDGIDELPELADFYDVMLADRNRRWLPALRAFLDDAEFADETIFIGVGALHLVGVEGLVDLLREAGYSVQRIDHFEHARTEEP